ncbi:DUF2500 domain-containing protein [Paenibacillus sp. MZ04-78.2]|uniref:DUF2500 domain-containing protein n=1 Tax=Paenibacillus sp. MZ04-78.2 TaxID=2962034 RepID=UPI0020B791B7|nr:DUF2500 domain-containing protein [Paenibacillus sp. MZ04-78.2]MCP3773061.1 DUF2500 domain-containing protein [Paenibacillus sp. MZ04-78.2]
MDFFPSSWSPFDGPPPFFIFFFVLILVLIVGAVLYGIFYSVSVWSANNASERLTVPGRVVAKRVSGGSGDSSALTKYFATFEFEDGGRVELPLKGPQYGLLVEGDFGELTYQGTRFIDFVRMRKEEHS